jgi:glycosyltransferase involved in cell wall biosynthesis
VHIHPEKYKLFIALIAKLASVGIITTTVHNVLGGLFKGAKLRNFKIKRWIARNILGVTFIAISPSVKEIEEEILSNPTELVPNWTDETKFFPAKSEEEKQMLRKELGIHENSLVIISVGSCIPTKNQKDIITCTHHLISKNYNIIYLLVGDGPLRQSYEEYAKQLGIEQYVRFVGQSNKVRDLLIASDVFVMASKYEGLGNSLLEALYCGLPAIVYNVYGLRDLVEDSKNGFVIETNPDMLADKLEILYNNEILRKQFGANGYEYVKKRVQHENFFRQDDTNI